MQAIRHWLAPLSPAESAALLRELSDLESGSPRQWLLLEIAATLGPGETSRRTRLIAFLARGFGIAALLPLLERLRLPGVSLYRERAAALGRYARQAIDDAALLLASFSALLAGFDRLPASRQFMAWLLLLIGGAIKLWRIRRRHPKPEPLEVSGEEVLPGAEAALGLQGLLLAHGIAPRDALALLAGLRADPQSQIPVLVAALPALQPPAPARGDLLRAALAGWSLTILPALWLNGWQWGWIGAVLWAAALCWIAHHRKTFILLLTATTLTSFGLARIAHFL